MPVTAKFSEEFYDRLGHHVADELVDWFNKADATYRTELKEVNELNFARFDAKIGQRFAEHDAKRERRFAEYDAKWERRFAEYEAKWEQRFAEYEAKWEQRFAEQDAKWERRLGELRTESFEAMGRLETRVIRWMVGLWLVGLGATVTLLRLWVA